jgi:molecular chaperone DnaK
MGRAVGIDLGTTNSCVAYLDGDKPVVIPNTEGSRTTPSVVAFAQNGDRLVGQMAKRQAITNPENTVYAAKRLIGRKLADADIQKHKATSPYDIVAAENGDVRVRLRGQDYSPAEVSAMILEKMRTIASDYLGEVVDEAVITVPAYFDDAQRQATKDAAKIAGLKVLRIINEPTAAALAYGMGQAEQKTETIVVYDLGGGTFDVSILALHDGVYEVRATSGDTYLGGEDFDRAIIDYLAERFLAAHQIDLRRDKMALQRLKEGAERAKHELSSSLDTEVNLPFIAVTAAGPQHLVERLERGQLESFTESLVQRTLEPCKTALADAGLTIADIDQVILVGGQTRMPRVQQVVEKFFGKRPNKRVDPDEVVAVGAALQAGVLTGSLKDVLLLDVTPLSLGIQTAGGVFTKLIPKNTTIPTRKTEVFSTAIDNQTFVEVRVLQGEREMCVDNKELAVFTLDGILPAARGVPQIAVTFDIDENGIVSAVAKDLGTNREMSVRVQASSGLTTEEIDRLVAESQSNKDSDAQRRELAELKLQLEGMLYTTERALAEFGNVLAAPDLAALNAEVAAAKSALESAELERVKATYAKLEVAAQKIGEMVYAQAAKA